MNKYLSIIISVILLTGLSSCWKEDEFSAGAPRHQVTDLKASPGDMEVELRWEMPEGWNPTDYIIKYNDDTQQEQQLRTGGEKTFMVSGLQNGFRYTFSVQAVYGDLISQAVEVAVTPATSRFAPSDLAGEGMDGGAVLTWTKPGTAVTGYTLTYGIDGTSETATAEIGADDETYSVAGLTNDVYYNFTLVAHYAKGDSDPVTIKVMPTMAIPYFVDRTMVAIGQPVTFTFNRQDIPLATDVKWTFPDGTVKTGDVVVGSFSSAGEDCRVMLSARIGSITKEWPVSINVREYVVFCNTWVSDGTSYNGFKGTCPVFSPDGKTVYIITFNKLTNLYAFDLQTGNNTWTYTPEYKLGSYNMLTVNPTNGDIYFGTKSTGNFFCVSALGSLRWKYEGTASMQSAAPAVSADGQTVYLSDKNGRTCALNAATGAERWQVALGKAGCGILVNGNEIVVGTADAIYFLDAASGAEIKKIPFANSKNGMADITGFAVGADKKTVYVPQFNGYLSSFDLSAREWIVKDFKAGNNTMYEPVVSPNGDVFVGCKDSHWYLVNSSLSQVKASGCPASLEGKNNGYNYSHPVVDDSGNFYITSGQVLNVTMKISPSGQVLDQWTDGSVTDQKQMGGNNFIDGILFAAMVGGNSESGLFIGKYVGGSRASSWSSHGGDICGSCCVK